MRLVNIELCQICDELTATVKDTFGVMRQIPHRCFSRSPEIQEMLKRQYNAEEMQFAKLLNKKTFGAIITLGWDLLRHRRWGFLRVLAIEAQALESERSLLTAMRRVVKEQVRRPARVEFD